MRNWVDMQGPARDRLAGIYAVITEKFCRNGSSKETLKQVLAAGVRLIQLREKEYSRRKICGMARQFRRMTRKAGAILIINDYPDIAAMTGADGVHLGQEDMPLAEVKLKYPGLLTGVSTHNLAEALRAQEQGADYINVGPIFPTNTKETGKYRPIGCARLKKIASGIRIPFSVMGGIRAGNIAQTAAAGADMFAMITGITAADDMMGAVRAMRAGIAHTNCNIRTVNTQRRTE